MLNKLKDSLNNLFTDSFFRFLFGFTIIIATSFVVLVIASAMQNSL